MTHVLTFAIRVVGAGLARGSGWHRGSAGREALEGRTWKVRRVRAPTWAQPADPARHLVTGIPPPVLKGVALDARKPLSLLCSDLPGPQERVLCSGSLVFSIFLHVH